MNVVVGMDVMRGVILCLRNQNKIRFCLLCRYNYLDVFNPMKYEVHIYIYIYIYIYMAYKNTLPHVRKHSVTITATKGLLLFLSVS
jgi:hypothetical protein